MNNYPMPGPGMNRMPNNQLVPQQMPPNIPPQQPHPPMTGLGITALVLGIVALLTSLVPIINNISFILALVGLVLGIIGMIACNRRTKSGRGIAVGGIVLCALSLIAVIVVQSAFSTAFDESFSAASSRSLSTSSSAAASSGSSATVSASSAATSAKYAVSIDDCTLGTDYQGQSMAIVTFAFTNDSDTDTSFMVATSAKAFQNGVQLDTAISTDVDSSALTKEIKPGATITLQKGYVLSDMSPLTIEVEELLNFGDDLLAEKTFTFE